MLCYNKYMTNLKSAKKVSKKKILIVVTFIILSFTFLYIKYISLYYFQKTTYISNKIGYSFGYYNYDKNTVSEYDGRNLAIVPTEKYHISLNNKSIHSTIVDIGIFDGKCESNIKNLIGNKELSYLETPIPSGSLYNNKMITVYDMKNVPDDYMLYYTKLACIENESKSALIAGVEKNEYEKSNFLTDTYNYLMFRRVVETFKFIN